MSTVKTVNLQHPSSGSPNLVLNADGSVTGGGVIVAVKHALFTGTQSNSTAAGANFAVTDLSITHEVADASNKLIISAFLGSASENGGLSRVGLGVDDGSGLIAVGDSPSSRTAVTAGGLVASPGSGTDVVNLSVTFVHTPGSGSKTYTVRAICVATTTQTIYINRNITDTDDASRVRGVSGLVIQEVKV